jgi:hypothetical protein
VPSVAAVMPAYDHETEWTKQVRASETAGDVHLQCAPIQSVCPLSYLLSTLLCLHAGSIIPSPHYYQVASDCIWSDPASEAMERGLDETGFGDSPRGGGAVWCVSILFYFIVVTGGCRIRFCIRLLCSTVQ